MAGRAGDMALGAFAILVETQFNWAARSVDHKKKGLPFLGRQPLVVQLLTLLGAKPNRYRPKSISCGLGRREL